MDTIIIPTTQNIELEYPIAGLSDRIAAGLIDILVMVGYLTAWGILQYYSEIDFGTEAWIIISLPVVMYSLLNEIFFNGQSIGKRLLKIKVVRLDGMPATVSSYLLRWLIRPIDLWVCYGLIGIISISVNKNSQRLGDIAAGTTVIKLKIIVEFWDSMFTEVQENYVVQFPEVEILSDKDMSILKEVFDSGKNAQNEDLLIKLSEKVKMVTGIETELDSKRFLETVLKDYNYIYGE